VEALRLGLAWTPAAAPTGPISLRTTLRGEGAVRIASGWLAARP
jgi:hypothetical protein